MTVIAFINLKGGVAKTTNAVALAECLASSGKTTLVIDGDHQCTATELLLGESRMELREKRRQTLHDLMLEMLRVDFDVSRLDRFVESEVSDINGGLDHLSVIPSSVRINDLACRYSERSRGFGCWLEFRKMFDKHRNQFREWIAAKYDYTIVDCPPSLAFQVKQLLRVSDAYVIPSQPNRLSLRGADWLCNKLESDGFRRVHPLGTLWSMCQKQDKDHSLVIEESTRGNFQSYSFPRPLEATVPLSVSIRHATERSGATPKTFRGKYGSKFAPVFVDIANELMTRLSDAGLVHDNATSDDELLVSV